MNRPLKWCGLFIAILFCACAREPNVEPGVYETVASWQYPVYRHYTKEHAPIGTGVSLMLRDDSTYEYASFQMNMLGTWEAIDDTLHLHCDSIRLINVMPLAEYYDSKPWTCPTESKKFVIGREMLYKYYNNPDGEDAVMILEKIKRNP